MQAYTTYTGGTNYTTRPTAASLQLGKSALSNSNNPNTPFHIVSAIEKKPNNTSDKSIQPTRNIKFDIIETDKTFILEGELPGVSDKDTVDIEFKDARILVIKGEIKRRFTEKKERKAATEEEEGKVQQQTNKLLSSTSSLSGKSPAAPAATVKEAHNQTATVSEKDEYEVVPIQTIEKLVLAENVTKPETETSVLVENAFKSEETSEEIFKYCLMQRSVGKFERNFTFGGLIDHEGAYATLESGILEVVIPKKLPHIRKINIL